MSLTALPEAGCSQPDAQADARADVQALIAEARAHARRRRLKVAAVLGLLALMTAAGLLIGRAVTGTRVTAQPGPGPGGPAAGTGIVTGHLAACFGLAPRNGSLPVTPGTVVVLRGTLTSVPDGPGTWRLVFPEGPAVTSEHISNNYDQTFRFTLPPGQYVLAGRYGPGPGFAAFRQVRVTAGAVIRVDLPSACM
jgi:hypothetical protein